MVSTRHTTGSEVTLTEKLVVRAREYLPPSSIDIVAEACRFAEQAHDGQSRLSGEPFVEHPLQTALYLADFRLDASALAAAVLHDVMEDCGVGFDELADRFGDEVARLVDGVTKLTKAELVPEHLGVEPGTPSDNLARAGSLRKVLMSMAEDVRVVLIKLADRLHNMRTLDALPEDRQRAIAQETLDIFAPLAHRLGIWDIKWRLEDLALRHIDPDAYRDISKLLSSKRDERERYIERVRGLLQLELQKAGIEAEVTGRPKHIYSIYKKMIRYASDNQEVGEIYDLFALRVLVKEVRDCYLALGVVHSKWHPLPGQFDDYIGNPKDNLYQSLHATVLCEDAAPVEVQIRTHEMHNLAEYGVADHWLYKNGQASDVQFAHKMTWLQQLLEWQREVSGAEEFVESFKTDVFKNQVFAYTPKGELKELPAGATVLDFAYRIHSDLGHRCIGAKVNGKLVPLNYRLKNGDTAEIVSSETVRGPSLEWLNPNLGYVRTGSAREKVRQWFNRQTRRVNEQRGREIFDEQLRRLDPDMGDVGVAKLMSFDTADQLFTALGSGSMTTTQVAAKLTSHQFEPRLDQQVVLPSTGPGSGIEVLGAGDLLTRIARCCNPAHGDEITGHITRNRGVAVHRSSCPNILGQSESEQMAEVRWGKTQTLYPVRVRLEALDRVGLLRDVTSLVSEERVNIASCVSEEYGDVSVISLTVYVDGIDQLSLLLSKLEGVGGVMRVARVSDAESATLVGTSG